LKRIAPVDTLFVEVPSMARKSKSSNNPNSVLVIFLVFFILMNIGFGVWVYTLVGDRDKWDSTAKDLQKKEAATKQGQDWYKFKSEELLAALGDPDWMGKSEVVNTWKEAHVSFLQNKVFSGEAGEPAFRATIKELEKILGVNDDNSYKEKLLEYPEQLKKKLLETQTKLALADKELKAIQTAKIDEEKRYKDQYKALADTILKGNNEALTARKEQNDAYKDAVAQNEALRKELDKQQEQFSKDLKKKEGDLARLGAKIAKQEQASNNPNRALAEPHALMLDISQGKTLWDASRAKIIRVEDSGRRLYIDKGAKDGIKVGLSFNVFSSSKNNRGEGKLKATIEVLRVEDSISLCKVNTVFGPNGVEVAISAASSSKLLLEGDNPLKEGDLAFNLFWGMHVAIVGVVDFTGSNASSPAAQMDSLFDFIRYLDRIGVIVDAYNDLRDGRMVGEITDQTNVLIRGASLRAPQKGEAEEDTRTKLINGNIAQIREQAISRGLFIISANNYAVVTGYRQPGGSNDVPTLEFTPRRPAGAPVAGGKIEQ
jgi:hypothetical protein